jgi:hypothetical protein
LTTLHAGMLASEMDFSADAISRRSALMTLGGAATASVLLSTLPAQAAGDSAPQANDILLRLRNIPTFTIVNSDGVPFMIYDGSASATGYFFMSFQLAKKTVDDARKQDVDKVDSFAGATIITVPLAVALQLGLRNVQRKALNNGILYNTFNDVVAAQEGVEDAKSVDSQNPDRWSQKGRVPIFFVNGLELDNGRLPRFFNKDDLVKEWTRQNPDQNLPPIQLVDMIDLFRYGLKKKDMSELDKFTFIPVSESNQVAAELRKKQSSSPVTYSFKDTLLVGTSKS